MNQPADIICFAKDWREPKTSNNHVMEEMAKRHRVLWVNSIATRNPNLTSANDLKKIFRRIKSWFSGVEVIHENLRVLTPVNLPFPGSRLAQRLNQWLVTGGVRGAANRWGLHRPQLWIFPPNAADYVGRFGESLVVYYCVDEWSEFSQVNADYIRRKEADLLRKANIVFVVSEKLFAAKSKLNDQTHLALHGVDHSLFSQALRDDFTVADELCHMPKPIIGFYGNLYDWVDQNLVAALARARPDWSFVLVGKIMSDVTTLRAHANIHLLGARPFEQLPHFCKGFDVGLIPYNTQDPRMKSVNPLKLREYLAAGLPVVSVDMPEVRVVGDLVTIAEDAKDFVEKIERAITQNSTAKRRERSERMQSESWSARVAAIESIVAGLDALQPVTVP